MTETTFSNFTGYKQTVIDMVGDLKKLSEHSKTMKLEGNAAAIDGVVKRLAEDTFTVAVVGEFKRGKSTLINALLEKAVLPADVVPCTATLNRVMYSVTPFVRIEFHDGRTEDIEIDRLTDYVTKQTPESERVAKTVKMATVYYPINYCKNGVTIVDTPGLNDDEAMTSVTMSVLPTVDAAIMVMMAGSPFSQYECDFLENKVMASDLGRVMFVVTGIDLYDDDDAQKVLGVITRRITDSVLLKAKNVHGENSPEFAACQRKLGAIRVHGLSAKKALKAKMKGDNEMLAQSLFPDFEAALEKFLTEERGAIMLNVPVNRAKTSAIEIAKAVELRQNALSMEAGDFNAKFNQAMEEIEKIRNDRQAEFSRINENADQTFRDLSPMIRDYWPALERAAEDAIDAFPLTPDALKEGFVNATQDALSKSVKESMAKVGQNITERIQEAINTALQSEAERMSGFEKRFYDSTANISNLFVPAKPGGDLREKDLALGTIGNFIGFGIGGIYMGFKQAGWKGALLGGGASLGVAAGVGLLCAALAIPLTWPVFLVGGVVGAFTSKFALGKMFGNNNQVEKFKASFKEAVLKEIARMKAGDDFSENVRKQIEGAFDALKAKIKNETENILGDTQNQLTQLRVEIAQAGTRGEQEKEELRLMLESVNAICARAETIGAQLTAVLAR